MKLIYFFLCIQLVSATLEGMSLSTSVIQHAGSRRFLEDYYIDTDLQDKSRIIGVLDGHGGDGHGGYEAALFAQENLPTNIENDQFAINIPTAITAGFLKTHQDFIAEFPEQKRTGTTALISIIKDSLLYIANLGMSRAVLVNKAGTIITETSDHKPGFDPDHAKKVPLGYISNYNGTPRVCGHLSVTRALGDAYLEKYLLQNPDVTTHQISEDTNFLILASNGIWHHISSPDLAQKFHEKLQTNDNLDAITSHIMDSIPKTGDDQTLMIVKFNHLKP